MEPIWEPGHALCPGQGEDRERADLQGGRRRGAYRRYTAGCGGEPVAEGDHRLQIGGDGGKVRWGYGEMGIRRGSRGQ